FRPYRDVVLLPPVPGSHAQAVERERGVGQAVSEGEQRLLTELIIVAVADEDILVVVHLAADAGVLRRLRCRPLVRAGGEGHRETPGWVGVAEEHRGDRGSRLLARVPSLEHPGRPREPRPAEQARPAAPSDTP